MNQEEIKEIMKKIEKMNFKELNAIRMFVTQKINSESTLYVGKILYNKE